MDFLSEEFIDFSEDDGGGVMNSYSAGKNNFDKFNFLRFIEKKEKKAM